MMNARNEIMQSLVLSSMLIVPAVLGGYFAIFHRLGLFGALGLLLSFIGVCFIIYSKLKLKRRTKKIIEWGMSGMSKREKSYYFLGYTLLVLSLGLVFISI